MTRNQAADAQALYDNRSLTYDESWHPRFARHTIELAEVRPGEHVLDLACGTGLVSYAASKVIGPTGLIVGIDISAGMLAQARAKLPTHDPANVEFHQHSITDLHTLAALKDKVAFFDLITCTSALVLLSNPKEALKQWATYLKPGGRLIVDVTHIQNQIHGIAFERVGNILDRPIPSYRLNFQSPNDLQAALEFAGLEKIQITPISQLDIPGTERLEDYVLSSDDVQRRRVVKEYSMDEGGNFFDKSVTSVINVANAASVVVQGLGATDIRAQAKEVFETEWRKMADEDGKIRELDCVYVGIGWKC